MWKKKKLVLDEAIRIHYIKVLGRKGTGYWWCWFGQEPPRGASVMVFSGGFHAHSAFISLRGN